MKTTSIIRHLMPALVMATALAAQLAAGLGAIGPGVGTASTSAAATTLPQLPEVVVTARRLPLAQSPF